MALAGHQAEAQALWAKVEELVLGSFVHMPDSGDWGFSLHRKQMHKLLFATTWFLQGQRTAGNLDKAVEHLWEAERRAKRSGFELGEDGYEEIALLQVLLGNGMAALEVLPKASHNPFDLDLGAVSQGPPTSLTTLALAAHFLVNPSCLAVEAVHQRIADGIRVIMRQQFKKPTPGASEILLWLDLPNVLRGRQGDPWAMLAQVNEMVGD